MRPHIEQQALSLLDRVGYLLRRISEGRHDCLEQAGMASDDVAAFLTRVDEKPEWDSEGDGTDAENDESLDSN